MLVLQRIVDPYNMPPRRAMQLMVGIQHAPFSERTQLVEYTTRVSGTGSQKIQPSSKGQGMVRQTSPSRSLGVKQDELGESAIVPIPPTKISGGRTANG